MWFCSKSLHVTLGWVKHSLDAVEWQCLQLDSDVLEVFGCHIESRELSKLAAAHQELMHKIWGVEAQEASLQAEIEVIDSSRQELCKDPDNKNVFDRIHYASNNKSKQQLMIYHHI